MIPDPDLQAPPAADTPSSAPLIPRADRLGDFTTDSRLLIITPMAAVVGLISAFVAVVLVWLIGSLTNLFYYHRFSSDLVSPAGNHLGAWAVLVPMVGGLLVGLMARYGSEKIRGHGIPEAMEAILIGRSRMSAKVALLKPLSSAISIGSGGPFGAEGPIIMTGGAFGSLFAQAFHLSAAERKTLLVAGAAGGMAAIFATPLAAVLLAVELLLFEWKPRSFIPVAASAAVAGAVRVPLLGAGPIFPVTPHSALVWQELLLALGVGIAAGLRVGRPDLAGLRLRRPLREAADPLHVVARHRRPVRRPRRARVPPVPSASATTPSPTSSTAGWSARSCWGWRSRRR